MIKVYSKVMFWVYVNIWRISPNMAEEIISLQLKGFKND